MEFSEKTFQILAALDRQEIFSQRQLAEHSGVSLAQVNYLLKRLLEKGLVKIKNFKNNPNKRAYLYLLTPKGIEAKSSLAVKFVVSKLREYNNLKGVLTERLSTMANDGPTRIIFIGPKIVTEFLESIIEERKLDLTLIGQLKSWEDLNKINTESFDVALIFDDQLEGVNKVGESLGLPGNKIQPL